MHVRVAVAAARSCGGLASSLLCLSVSLSLSRSLCFSSTHVSCPLSIAMHSQQDPLYRLCGQEASAPGAARRAQCCAGIGRSPLPGTVVADDDDAEE